MQTLPHGTAIALALTFTGLVARPLHAEALEPALLIQARANLPLEGCEWIWGEHTLWGAHLAYVSCYDGLYTVDVSSGATVLAYHSGMYGDVEVHDGYMYSCRGEIIDVSVYDAWTTVAHFTASSCHNLSYDPVAKHLYVATATDSVLVYDLSPYPTPSSLPDLLAPDAELPASHDVVGAQRVAFLTTKGIPWFPYSGSGAHPWGKLENMGAGHGFLHTLWPTADLNFVVAAKEGAEISDFCPPGESGICVARGGLTLFKFDPEAANPSLGMQRDTFFLPSGISGSAHKHKVMGDYIYAAFYQAGLQVLKINRSQSNWRLQASFDTSTEAQGLPPVLEAGAFDVFPFLGHDRLLIVDSESGLWVLEHTTAEALASYLAAIL